jgi:hypothetical protein
MALNVPMSPAVIAGTRLNIGEISMSGRARAMISNVTPGTKQMTGTAMYPRTRTVKARRAMSRRPSVAARVVAAFVEDDE